MRTPSSFLATSLLALALAAPSMVSAQTPEQWISWGDRVHGGFGSLIALGVIVGQDALARLDAERRDLAVDYTDGPQSPCACVIDGIAVAVSASVGQRTLRLESERTESGLLARIRFTRRSDARSLVYEIPQPILAVMAAINRDPDPLERWRAVNAIDRASLFRVIGP